MNNLSRKRKSKQNLKKTKKKQCRQPYGTLDAIWEETEKKCILFGYQLGSFGSISDQKSIPKKIRDLFWFLITTGITDPSFCLYLVTSKDEVYRLDSLKRYETLMNLFHRIQPQYMIPSSVMDNGKVTSQVDLFSSRWLNKVIQCNSR